MNPAQNTVHVKEGLETADPVEADKKYNP